MHSIFYRWELFFSRDFCGISFFLKGKKRKNPDKNIACFRHDRTANKSWFQSSSLKQNKVMMWSYWRDHTHPTANTQLPQTTHIQFDAVFVRQQLLNTADHKSAVPARVQTSLPSAAIGCNSPLCAPAVGSSGWESLSLTVGRLSAENWHCAGRHWPSSPCRKHLCLPHPPAGWRCRCTGHAGSCASVCCCNYCCYLHRYFPHLCCCSPSPSCSPLFHSSPQPEVLPARANSGQSCATALYQVAGDIYVLHSVTAPFLL